MSEIPDDIRRVARAIAHVVFIVGSEQDDLTNAIGRAIMAERERCAQVAEHLNGWGADCGRGGHAEHIAKIIRMPRTHEVTRDNR